MLETCNLYDEALTPSAANLAFYVSANAKSDGMLDFGAAAKEAERREQAARLALLQKRRRAELSAAAAAVDMTLAEEGEAILPVLLGAAGGGGGEEMAARGSGVGLEITAAMKRQTQAQVLAAWEAERNREAEDKKKNDRGTGAGGRAGRKPPVGGVPPRGGLSPAPGGAGDGGGSISGDAAALPADGWPCPVPSEVQLIASLEMASLGMPVHRAGDPTWQQQQQLDLDLAELPQASCYDMSSVCH